MELRAWRELPEGSRGRIESIMGSPAPGLYRNLGRYLDKADKPYRAEAIRFLFDVVAPQVLHEEPETDDAEPVRRRGRPRKAA